MTRCSNKGGHRNIRKEKQKQKEHLEYKVYGKKVLLVSLSG
jgi:hypothetical protein